MSFSVHTFEINPDGNNLGFAFHQKTEEGREVYFLGKFQPDTVDASIIAEDLFSKVVDALEASTAMDQYEAFELAMKAANDGAKKMKQKLISTPEIVIAYFDFNHLYRFSSLQQNKNFCELRVSEFQFLKSEYGLRTEKQTH